MISIEMKIPKNRQSRLSDDVWLASEAIARHFGMSSSREGLETAIRFYVAQMAETNSKFSDVWEKVKSEGVEDS